MGFEVGVFYVEKEKDILELVHVGINYITTDSPKRIKELILQITLSENWGVNIYESKNWISILWRMS